VKFKTAEKVGPVGEGQSCEAQAIVLLTLHGSDDSNPEHNE
jgi:2C-methyl-D-erythritol 2,4-cyclodiphosphate synthase